MRRRRPRLDWRVVTAGALALAFLLGRWTSPGPRPDEAPGVSTGPPAVLPDEMTGPCEVNRVVDGDTIYVTCAGEEERIRLLRIDTPERGEPGYATARRAMRGLVEDRDVYLIFEEPGVPDRDQYGRLLAYAFVDGRNVSVEMVRRGHSPFWTRFGAGRFAEELRRAERETR